MRRGFKPYSKRKPFKRKNGGSKFFLGGGTAKFSFSATKHSMIDSTANLIALITKSKQRTT